ncbi:MAG: phosphohydrolase [Deltaproteobacteria bacterium]|nr:phosphohydrolase [Deltaproteobacteria bacterium]
MEWSEFTAELFRLAEPYLAVRNDLPHAQISYQYSLKLLSAEGGNRRIVEPAVILHDVGWSKLTPEQIKIAFGVRAGGEEADRLNRIHEVEGAIIAGHLLQGLDYDPIFIKQITLMIGRHDSGNDPESLEEKILKDSDKLWRFSGIGFWNEMERQGLDSLELYRFLEKRRPAWFFLPAALVLAEEALKVRAREIADRSGSFVP